MERRRRLLEPSLVRHRARRSRSGRNTKTKGNSTTIPCQRRTVSLQRSQILTKTTKITEQLDFQHLLGHLGNMCFPLSDNCCCVNYNWGRLVCVSIWKGYKYVLCVRAYWLLSTQCKFIIYTSPSLLHHMYPLTHQTSFNSFDFLSLFIQSSGLDSLYVCTLLFILKVCVLSAAPL